MTFLDPMSAIVAAGLSLATLVALYLLKLRRRPVRVSSTLLWRSAPDDTQANVPLRWLRASWLLLLHALILALLAGAMGRPTLAARADARGRLVVLVDRSASMSCRDGPGTATRLDAAKKAALDVALRAAESGSSVSIVSFAARAAAECGFTSSAAALRRAVNDIGPTDQPGDLAGALRVTESLLAEGSEESNEERPRVCLVSDGGLSGEETPTLSRAVLSLTTVGREGAFNAGIVAISARREYEDPARVRVFARVASGSAQPRDIAVTLLLDGAVVEKRSLALEPAGAPESAPGPGPDGVRTQAVATFEIFAPSGGLATVRLDAPDALACDDRASLLLAPARRASIVLVHPDAERTSPTVVPPWLLEDALSQLDAASFRSMTATQYEQAAQAGTLGECDLVVFDRVRPPSGRPPPCASLSFGAGLALPGLDLAETAESTEGGYILAWERTHPVLRDAALDQVYVARPLARAPGAPGRGVQELATGPEGPLLLLASDGAYRRMVVAFDPAMSNWPLQVSFAVFLASAVDYLTLRAEESAGRSFSTSQPVDVRAPAGAARFELRRAPDQPEPSDAPGPAPAGDIVLQVAVPPGHSGEPVPAGLIERAGVYRVVPGGERDLVAVNLVSAPETACAVRSSVTIGGAAVGAVPGGTPAREIWDWFLGAAAALLAVEWIVFAARARA